MYIPKPFALPVDQPAAAHAVITDNPFAAMVLTGADGIEAVHIPFLLDAARGPHGTLRAHVARANPIWRHFGNEAAMVIFWGPHAYVSPDWYVSEGLVPTWNYEAVEAQGQARIMSAEDTYALIVDLSAQEEEKLRPKSPWKIEKVPEKQAQALLRAIVGIEIDLTELTGKRKMSQNRSAEDRAGVASALRLLGGDASEAVADLINPS